MQFLHGHFSKQKYEFPLKSLIYEKTSKFTVSWSKFSTAIAVEICVWNPVLSSFPDPTAGRASTFSFSAVAHKKTLS
jgi:hypothetical protein